MRNLRFTASKTAECWFEERQGKAMSEQHFTEGQKIILLPDCSAVAADSRLLAYETYCLDYVGHIPISIKNHPLKTAHFQVIVLPSGKKAVEISADEEAMGEEAELLEELEPSDCIFETDICFSECQGETWIAMGNEPVLYVGSDGSISVGDKIFDIRLQMDCWHRLCLTVRGAEGKMDVWLDSKAVIQDAPIVWKTPVRKISVQRRNGTLRIGRMCCYRGVELIPRASIPKGVLVRFHNYGIAEGWKDFVFPMPTGGEMVARMLERYPNRAHHRLYLTDDRVKRIQERGREKRVREWQREYLKEAEGYLEESPPEFLIQDGIRLLPIARLIKRRLLMFSTAWRLTGDARFVEACLRYMEKAAAYPHWNDTHFLDTAELCCGFAIAYDAIYERLTEQEKSIYSKTIIDKALLPAMYEYRFGQCRTRNQWADNDGNWNPVCNAGILIGALAVTEDAPALAEEIIDASLQGITHCLVEFLPDGAWREGVGYWHYTIEFITYYFDALLTAVGSTYGFLQNPAIEKTAEYYLAMLGPGGSFNYGDMEPQYMQSPELYWYADVLNRPELAHIYARVEREYQFPMTVRALLHCRVEWAESSLETALPCDMAFRKWWVGSLRSSWSRTDSYYLAFQGGRPNAGHSQMSIGNFVFDAYGERWALDLGCDDYNLDYLDVSENADAWWIYRKSTEGHNCMLLNPDQKHFQIFDSDSPICAFQSKTEYSYSRLNLTPAYQRQTKQAFRTFYLDKEKLLAAVMDEMVLREKHSDYYWLMHTDAEIVLSEDRSSAVLRKNGREIHLTVAASQPAVFSVMQAAPLPSSPAIAVRSCEAENKGVQKLAVHITGLTGNVWCGVLFSGQKVEGKERWLYEMAQRCGMEEIYAEHKRTG